MRAIQTVILHVDSKPVLKLLRERTSSAALPHDIEGKCIVITYCLEAFLLFFFSARSSLQLRSYMLQKHLHRYACDS